MSEETQQAGAWGMGDGPDPTGCPVCQSDDYRQLEPGEAGGLEEGEIACQCEECGEVWV